MKCCFICGLSQKKLVRQFVDLLTQQLCPLAVCERCKPDLKPRCYEQCKDCGKQFRYHDWSNQWLRFYNSQAQLRSQLKDKLMLKEDFFSTEQEMQHFYLLIELLIECRRSGSNSYQYESKIKNFIEDFIQQKKMAQGIHKVAAEDFELDRPKFICKVDNPRIAGMEASSYDLEHCYNRGLEMLRRKM